MKKLVGFHDSYDQRKKNAYENHNAQVLIKLLYFLIQQQTSFFYVPCPIHNSLSFV